MKILFRYGKMMTDSNEKSDIKKVTDLDIHSGDCQGEGLKPRVWAASSSSLKAEVSH